MDIIQWSTVKKYVLKEIGQIFIDAEYDMFMRSGRIP